MFFFSSYFQPAEQKSAPQKLLEKLANVSARIISGESEGTCNIAWHSLDLALY